MGLTDQRGSRFGLRRRLPIRLGVVALGLGCALGNSAQAQPMGVQHLAQQILEVEQKLAPLVPEQELADSLYWGWFDRPYRRATIAAAIKTARVIKYEQRLRLRTRGSFSDAQLQGCFDWLSLGLVQATLSPRWADFYAHRVKVDWVPVFDTENSHPERSSGLRLFGFVDRSSATSHDPQFGDLDVLAGLGFRIVGVPPREAHDFSTNSVFGQRAAALGIHLVQFAGADIQGRDSTTSSESEANELWSGTLSDFMNPGSIAAVRKIGPVAIGDRPRGELWAESLARRGLYRGVLGCANVVVSGFRPPRMPHEGTQLAEQFALAMWMHALDGQSLALIEGWRDLRDGSASPYPSLGPEPKVIESIAHTALDLLYHRNVVKAFAQPVRVAVLVPDSAIRERDENRWSKPFARLFAALVDAHIRFDVLPLSGYDALAESKPYEVVIAIHPDQRKEEVSLLAQRFRADGAVLVSWSLDQTGGLEELVTRVQRGTRYDPTCTVMAHTAVGHKPVDVLVLFSRDGSGSLAIANPTDQPCTAIVTNTNGRGDRGYTDLISGDTITQPALGISLKPLQVRLLIPNPAGR